MRNYENVKVSIAERQKEKLKKRFESKIDIITIHFKFEDLNGEDVIAITKLK